MKRGPAQILLALDFLFNALTWGNARQTFSARTGLAVIAGKRWGRIIAPIIDRFFGQGHCEAEAMKWIAARFILPVPA